ncbi:MAG: aspartate/glutamate racemase family protein [Actinobacteria bacterium]|nr:aspartate/glutamate racemase family protein [Actinomycetota bacterium]
MNKKVALIHTGFVLVEVLKKLFSDLIPEAELINIVDDSLLKEVISSGGLNANVTKRIVSYGLAAKDAGADTILNVCSSVSEAADVVRQVVNIPVVKIDESMAEEAVGRAIKIGVVATLATTLDPTCRLIEKKALELSKQVKLEKKLCEGAFELLISGNAKGHDEMVMKTIIEASRTNEIVVLAQGSMARLADSLPDELKNRVLSSPRSGVLRVKETLNSMSK